MSVHFRRAAAAMLAAMTMAAMPSTLAIHADDVTEKKIVVLGDGISSGKGLDSARDSYVSRLESYYRIRITNLSTENSMSDDLLLTLDDPDVKAQLADADVIVFSVGLHDLSADFDTELRSFMEANELEFEGVEELFAARRSEIKVSDDALSTEANVLASKLRSRRESCKENILAIGEKLSAYRNAQVIGLNVYNFLDRIEQYSSLSMKRKSSYNTIMNPCRSVLNNYINAAYQQIGEQYGIHVVDVFTGFDQLAYKYTGLNDMNYYPNKAGHAYIAGQLENLLGPAPDLPPMGDVNNDGSVDARDATAILVAATKIGTGGASGLTEEQEALADVNGDGLINSIDATCILCYSAAHANDDTVTLDDFI